MKFGVWKVSNCVQLRIACSVVSFSSQHIVQNGSMFIPLFNRLALIGRISLQHLQATSRHLVAECRNKVPCSWGICPPRAGPEYIFIDHAHFTKSNSYT
ncbi:hypothetical protein RIF29_17802 [Crotalaria pallida]|uniref:Uncharacterized protein n=1 Tax=Crotalaria pallida TaxID=3830 RepID=A0AAN9FPP6_CROPI